jgi:TP901 family phage tail tape measure protein
MPTGLRIPTTFTAVDKFTSVVKKMTSGVLGFSKTQISAISRVDKKITGQFKKLSNLSQLLLGLSVGAVFTSAAQDVVTFEKSLIAVSKTTDISGKELKVFSDNVIQTSKELKTVSSIKLLEIAQTAGQLGVKGSDNILKFSKTMAMLESATEGSVVGEEGAKSIARILNITGEGVGIVDRFGSALVKLGNDSAANEGEILGVANEVARSTAAYKLNSVEVLGLSAAFKSLGVQPEAAGSAIGKTLRQIELATISGGKDLAAFAKVSGVSSAEFVKAFKDNPTKAFDFFVKGLNRIGTSGGSMTKALLDVGLKGEIVSKGILPLAGNVKILDEAMLNASTGFENNIALQKEFDKANQTIAAALKSVRIAFANIITEASTAGTTLNTVRDVLFFVADNMGTLVGIGATLIGLFILMKGILIVTTAWTWLYNAAIGFSAGVNGKLTKSIAKNTVTLGAYKVAQALGAAWTWIGTAASTAFAFAMNAAVWPILLVIAAIAAIIAIFYYWDDIVAWFSKTWVTFTNWIGGLWDDLVSWFKAFDFKAFFMDIGQSIVKFLLFPMRTLLSLLSNMPGKLGDLAKMGLEKIDNLTGKIDVNDNTVLPSIEQQQAETTMKTKQEGQLNVQIRDPGGNVESTEGTGNIPINISETQGAF